MVEPFVSNIISDKYDTALDFHVTMYDNLPYQRDSDYCNAEHLTLHNKNLIKYYLYMYEPTDTVIDNGDDIIEEYLRDLKRKMALEAREKPEILSSDEDNDGVTEEQIQTLLDDKDNDTGSSSSDDEDDLSNTTNPFADVEDW